MLAGEIKNGLTVDIDGNVYQVVEFQHVKPGKGAAFVRTKLKNVVSGGIIEKTFRPDEKLDQAIIDRVDMQYLYNDGDLYHFMDMNTYEDTALSKDQIGDALKYLKENDTARICSYKGNVFSVEPPMFVDLEVTDTEPGYKGNTVNNTRKPAVLETGIQIMVPYNINVGDVVKIDTRTGEYLSRA